MAISVPAIADTTNVHDVFIRSSSSRSLDVDRFRVHELLDAVASQFPSIARLFYTAKRQPRVRRDETVDEGASRLEISRQAFAARDVFRKHRCAKPEDAVVRD